MEHDFWHTRWHAGQIAFHLATVNPYLLRFWDRVTVPEGARVFVPLSGKSVDMRWLAERGHDVVGVEVSDVAVRAFFDEWGVHPERRDLAPFHVYAHGSVTLFCGDFFAFAPEHLGDTVAVYDRASLIAFPAGMREPYVRHLLELLGSGERLTEMLLITLEYPQHQMQGPPFSVLEAEVRSLFEPVLRVDRLCREEVLGEHERFRAKGLSELHECAYLLTPAAAGP